MEVLRAEYCSAQPCKRIAEGELEFVDDDGETHAWPICPRHYEFIAEEVRTKGIDPSVLLDREVVFVDDIAVSDRFIIDNLVKDGNPYKIVQD